MAFSKETIDAAYIRSQSKCECNRSICGHYYQCAKPLNYNAQGKDFYAGAWEAHHKLAISSGGSDGLSNCEILCIDCHKNTGSYGRY